MPSLKPHLLPLLQKLYPHARYDSADPDLIVTFAGPPEVGNLEVWEEGDVATLAIGKLTHTHLNGFNCYPCPPNTPQDEIVKRVTAEVLEFLENFFAERIVLWKKSSDEGASLGPVEAMPAPTVDGSVLCYSWKGRLNPKAG